MMAVEKGPWPTNRPARFEPFSPADWQGKEPPALDWIVDGCLLTGTVSMLSGDGGLGKSLLLQQLLTAAALGIEWLGLRTKRVRTFGFFCEDDKGELQRRQIAINRHYGCDMADLEDMLLISRVGEDNIMMEFPTRGNDRGKVMPVYQQLEHAVKDFGAQLIGIDTLADVFGGNENFRGQARNFINMLRRLAIDTSGGVLMPAHPSNAGITSGTGSSGNTGWNNTIRSRFYLTRRKPVSEDQDGADDTERYLKTMKNNYGPAGGKIPLKWSEGVFVVAHGDGAPVSTVSRIELDNRLVEALRMMIENGSFVPAAAQTHFGFANAVRKLTGFDELSQGTVLSAQHRMVKAGRLVVVHMERDHKPRTYLRPADMRYPGEKQEG